MRRSQWRRMAGTVSVNRTEVSGTMPVAVVVVRSYSRRLRDEWHRTAGLLGLGWRVSSGPDGDTREWPGTPETAVEVWGSPISLAALDSGEYRVVVSVEYGMNRSVPRRGTGQTKKQ